jgi:CheY-like chemotaxis protein
VTSHLLLVEDNRADALLFRMALRGLCQVQVLEDGDEALARLRKEGPYAGLPLPSLVVLDLNLPKRSGLEVLALMKQDRRLSRIPVLVLSTSNNPRDIVDAYETGAAAYLKKPTDLDETTRMLAMVEQFWFGVAMLPREDAPEDRMEPAVAGHS